MGDFRDLPLLPEAPSVARTTTWQIAIYSVSENMSTIYCAFFKHFIIFFKGPILGYQLAAQLQYRNGNFRNPFWLM